jgi:hypothetical protein
MHARVRTTRLVTITVHGHNCFSLSARSSVTTMVPLFRSTGSSRSKVTWPRQPAQLPVQSRGSFENPDPETISLRTLIETRCPSVLTPFRPAWWLFKYVLDFSFCLPLQRSHLTQSSGHLQTGYASFGDFSQVDSVVYDRYATTTMILDDKL